MDSEEWTNIKGYDYFISTHGNVENALTGELLKPRINKGGYYDVSLCKNGKAKNFKVHRLVANAFIDNPYNKKNVDHRDGNRTNNKVNNLRYATDSENQHNKSMQSNNTSGVTGINFDKRNQKWYARITINSKTKFIGYFKTKEEATLARKEYANEYYGEYTHSLQKL